MIVLVLLATQMGALNTVTAWAVAIFFWLRLAHAVGMISGIARFPVRPVIFVAGWACVLTMGWQVLTA